MTLPSRTSVGGYPLVYVAHGGEPFCGDCMTDAKHFKFKYIHFEGADIECEICGEQIESAYGDPEED